VPGAFAIRPYQPGDLEGVIAAFQSAVRVSGAHDYGPAQIRAWARVDRRRWRRLRLGRPTWVAVAGAAVAGFADLEPSGRLGMLYVHADHQGRGVARALLAHIEAAARRRGIGLLFAESSLTARPFFARHGFRAVAPLRVSVRGQVFETLRMEKRLVRRHRP